MAIDLGDIPSGTEPTTAEKLQIRSAIGVGTTDAPTFLAQTLTANGSNTSPSLKIGAGAYINGWYSFGGLQLNGVVNSINMFGINTAGTNIANGHLSFGSGNLKLEQDADGILAQRNGVNAQAFRIYNSYTDANNYSRLKIGWDSATYTAFTIEGQQLGTGGGRSLALIGGGNVLGLGVTPSTAFNWVINAGHLLAGADNAHDIGASGANRPRFIYAYNLAPSGFLSFQNDSGMIYFGGGGDVIIQRDAAGILSQKNGTSAQAFRVYNQGDAAVGNPTNYDRGVFDFKTKTNTLRIGTENGGTYTLARPIEFVTGEVVRMSIAADGLVTVNGELRANTLFATAHCIIGASNWYYWTGKGGISAPSDGVIKLGNVADNGFTRLELGTTNLGISRGTGSPEGVVTALVGSLYIRTDGGASTTLYVKESSPTPSTGWVGK